jgi:GNAT superfamily N-acetyltransferase
MKQSDLRIEFEPFMDAGVRQSIESGLDHYNIAATSLPDWHPVNYVLRSERGDVLGGVLGLLWGGWLQVSYLWVSDSARGMGYGTRLMETAEAYARSQGAVAAALETYSFQARPFYERLGYEVFGRLDGYPTGHTKFFLKKNLS